MCRDVLNMHHSGFCECQKLERGLCVCLVHSVSTKDIPHCSPCFGQADKYRHIVCIKISGRNGLGSIFLAKGSPVPLGVPPPSLPISTILPGL